MSERCLKPGNILLPVMDDIPKLEVGAISEWRAPLLPAPLMDMANGPGTSRWVVKEEESDYRV